MLNIDFVFFVAFIIFSFLSFSILVFISRKVTSHPYYGKILKGAKLLSLLLLVIASLFFFFSEYKLIIFIGFIAILALNLIYLIKGASQALQAFSLQEEKCNALEKELKLLRDEPNIGLEIKDKLFQIPNEWLNVMIECFEKPQSFESEVFPFILNSLQEAFDGDGSVFFLADAFDDSLVCKSYIGSFPPPYKLADDVPHKEDVVKMNFKHYECNIGKTLFGKVAESGEPYYITSYTDDGIVFQNGDEPFLKIGSIMAFPLFTMGEISGVFALSRNSNKPSFSEKDFNDLSGLAQYFSSILSLVVLVRDYNEMTILDNTSNVAQEFRQLLLPKKLDKFPSIDVAAYFRKQHGVCSDYYDVIVHKDRIFAVVLDVAGKSAQAVVIMIMIRAILYLITNTEQSLDSIIDWLNKGITGKVGIDHFSTITLLCYYPETYRLEVVVAGSHSMILYKAKTKEVEIFHHRSDPIGIDTHSKYKSLSYELGKGDVVSVYTDGIPAMLDKNGTPFKIDKLAKLIAGKSEGSAKDIVKACSACFKDFSSELQLHDDQTLLVIKTK